MSFWRTLLFVPADSAKLIKKVASKGAGAIILDLEDAVSAANKAAARKMLKSHIDFLKQEGCDVCVRINAEETDVQKDIDALSGTNIDAIIVPKVDAVGDLERINELTSAAELGGVDFIPLIESATAMPNLYDIAAYHGVIGLALGTEDFSLSMGIEPSFSCLELPSKMIALAAASQKIMSLAVPETISNFTDIDTYRSAAETGKSYGVTGAICVHPNQVTVVNDVYKSNAEQLMHARQVIDIWMKKIKTGEALAVISGQMIDKPVVLRAISMLKNIKEETPDLEALFPNE